MDNASFIWIDNMLFICHFFLTSKVFSVIEKSRFKFLNSKNLDFNITHLKYMTKGLINLYILISNNKMHYNQPKTQIK